MSVRVYITYKLKPETTMDEYYQFSREIDQPLASAAPGVLNYEIFEVKGAGEGSPDFTIIEDIECESWEAWLKVNDMPEVRPAYEGFMRLADPGSVRVHWAEKV